MKLEIRDTADGSKTLFQPELNEQYHSMNGALTESKHVFIEKGYRFHPAPSPVVFEVGFGTGLNCLLTACLAEELKRPTFYISVEKYPLASKIIKNLEYEKWVSGIGKNLFSIIHKCEWGQPVQLSENFKLMKINGDFTGFKWQIPQLCDIIYFDAFGPEKQPEMWTFSIISGLYDWLNPGGVFVTYSAKGEVRRSLVSAGFKVERLPGPPGKKEMLRAIKMNTKN